MLSFLKLNLLLSSFDSGGESGDDGDDDGLYAGLTVDYMDENVGDGDDDGHAHGHDDKAEVPFVDFLECYSFADSSIFSLSS